MIDAITGSSKGLVTVIMNCLNCEKYLQAAIDSVFAQTYTNWEIVFWDNCSCDGSAEIANRYDGRLRYFRGDKTIPLGEARNEAIKVARGEFLAFLDCDDLWMPNKLERQVLLFDEPQIGLVFSNTLFFNDSGDIGEPLYGVKRRAPQGQCFRELLNHYSLSMETVVIRRSALDTLSDWFDPRFNMIEEADLFRRIAYQWKLAGCSDVLAKWRVRADSLTWSKYEYFEKETMIMLDKYKTLFPNFEDEYRNEIFDLKIKFALKRAVRSLGKGQVAEARSVIAPYRSRDYRTFVIYVLSYLGILNWGPVLRLLQRKAGQYA